MRGHLNELDEERVRQLISDLAGRVRSDLPDWTDSGSGDPGITLLELFAFLAENLLYRAGRIPAPTKDRLNATIERLVRLLGEGPAVFLAVDGEPWKQVPDFSGTSSEDPVYVVREDPDGGTTVVFGDGVNGRRPPQASSVTATYRAGAQGISVESRWPFEPCASRGVEWRSGAIRFLNLRAAGLGPIRRVRYFSGQILGAGDFLDEQTYFRDKISRHNRHLHGAGVVQGLDVEASSGSLRVSAGYALDASGNELVVPQPVDIPLPGSGDQAYVVLRYAERPAVPLPVPSDEEPQSSRIEEGFDLQLEQAPDPCGVPVGRIVRRRSGWVVDRKYRPPRCAP